MRWWGNVGAHRNATRGSVALLWLRGRLTCDTSLRSGPGKPNQRKVSSWTFRRGIPEQKLNVNRACFPKERHQNSQKRAKFMNFLFWPFLWFGLLGRLLNFSWVLRELRRGTSTCKSLDAQITSDLKSNPLFRKTREGWNCRFQKILCTEGGDKVQAVSTQPQGPKMEKIQDRPPGLKISSGIETFKWATRQTPIFCGEFWRSGIEIFDRDWFFSIAGPSGKVPGGFAFPGARNPSICSISWFGKLFSLSRSFPREPPSRPRKQPQPSRVCWAIAIWNRSDSNRCEFSCDFYPLFHSWI